MPVVVVLLFLGLGLLVWHGHLQTHLRK